VDLGALGPAGVTPLGRRMIAFPVHPRYARMLLAAQEYRCVPAVALIAALTQGRNLLRRLDGKQAREDREDVLGSDAESDLFILMRAFRYAEKSGFDSQRCSRLGINAGAAREAAQLTEQFLAIARDEGLDLKAGWTPERCVVRSCTDAAECWPAKAPCTTRACSLLLKFARSKAARKSGRFCSRSLRRSKRTGCGNCFRNLSGKKRALSSIRRCDA